MTTYRPAPRTMLDTLRRSRSLACATLCTTLFSIVGPFLPRTARAQSGGGTPPNTSGGPMTSTGLQAGQTDLGVPETGPAASSGVSWSVDPSTGVFGASIPFLLPKARGAAQPSLALVYSSTGGRGVGGMGWALNLPNIERHNLSGSPQYANDPYPGGPISGAQDRFTFAGQPLVPICLVGGSTQCPPPNDNKLQETMPTWATGGWHYYLLEVETGSNLRFFWSPSHETWIVQEPSGATMELGVAQHVSLPDQGGLSDQGGIDYQVDLRTGKPQVFRWNLVRYYDAARIGAYPSNATVYVWSKLAEFGTTSLISDLTDMYDTAPVGDLLPSAGSFAHHTHLNYTQFEPGDKTTVARAHHTHYLTGVDVTSQTFGGGGQREQVRRYVLRYGELWHRMALNEVQLDGWCSSGAPTEDPTTFLLPPEPQSGPACGVLNASGIRQWPPSTTFTYTTPTTPPTPTLRLIPQTFNVAQPQYGTTPSILDVNSDGLPDVLDANPPASLNQTVWLNSAAPGATLNTWASCPMTMVTSTLKAQAFAMNPFGMHYMSGAVLNDAHINGIVFDPDWNPFSSTISGNLTGQLQYAIYSPRLVATVPPTYDWGTPVTGTLTTLFPGLLQNCVNEEIQQPCGSVNDGFYTETHCGGPSEYLGGDQKYGQLDLDGDGLQDLLITNEYSVPTTDPSGGGTTDCTSYPISKDTPHYSTYLAAKFTTRATNGVVQLFSTPAIEETSSAQYPFSSLYADHPNICVSGANVLPDQTTTFADINGDGLPDWVKLYTDHFAVSYGHGDGVFGVCSDGGVTCACADGTTKTFSTGKDGRWKAAWSPLNTSDSKLSVQFHDVDGDGYDDAVLPTPDGFTVYFVVTMGWFEDLMLHVDVQGAFGWGALSTPGQPGADAMYMFADMDASGVDDVVIENSSGAMGYVNVAGGQRPGLLTVIQTAGQLATTITYQDLPSLSRASTPRWATQSPQSLHVVTDVLVRDLTPAIPNYNVETTYTYADPMYDGRDRQFIGFSTVEVVNVGDAHDPSMHTKTTFYPGYCDDSRGPGVRALHGATTNPCPTTPDYPNHALRGLPVLTETYGDLAVDNSDGAQGPALSTIHRSFSEQTIYLGMKGDGRNVHRTYVANTDTYWYDNSSVVARHIPTTLVDVVADGVAMTSLHFHTGDTTVHTYISHVPRPGDIWGMSANTNDYGLVDGTFTGFRGTDPSPAASIDGVVTDAVTAKTQDTVDNWIWRPSIVMKYGTGPRSNAYMGSSRVVSYTYDNRGNIQTMSSQGITLAHYTVDQGSGNVMRVQQESTLRCQDFAYDSGYSQLPTAVTTHVHGCNDAGLTLLKTNYVRGLGLVTDGSASDGQRTTLQYEPYGRLQSVARPDLNVPGKVESYPGIAVDYGDTLSPRTVRTTVNDGASLHDYVTALDGYGRSYVQLAPADTGAGDTQSVIQSGQVLRDPKGRVYAQYPAIFTSSYTIQPPDGPSRAVQYDAFGRILSATDLDMTPILQRTYSALSYTEQDAQQLKTGDAFEEASTAVNFDGHGRPVWSDMTAGGAYVITTATYLPTGELWILDRNGTDAKGVASSYERWMQYDSLGRMVLNVEPSTSTGYYTVNGTASLGPRPPPSSLHAWTYAYDDAGDLVATADARGCGKNVAYDGAGRPLYEDYIGCTTGQATYSPPNPATGEGTEAFYQYDALGHLSDVFDRAAHTHYNYDARSRVTSVQRNLVQQNLAHPLSPVSGYAPHTFEQAFLYDDLNRVIGQTTGEETGLPHLNGAPVPFGSMTKTSAVMLRYSERGVLKGVDSSYGPLVRQYAYDANGLPLATSWGDIAPPPSQQAVGQWGTIQGTQTTYTYDARQRLQERVTARLAPSLWTAPTGSYSPPGASPNPTTQLVLEKDVYGLDAVGNPTTIDDLRSPPEWPTVAQPVSRSMGYDKAYHLTSADYTYAGGMSNYASPTAAATATESPLPLQKAIARIGSETFSYDPFGNRTSSGDETGYFFDRSLGAITIGAIGTSTKNQVASAVLGAGNLTTNYDETGNLVRLNVMRTGACESSLGCMQLFDYEWDEVGRLARARRYDFAGPESCSTQCNGTACRLVCVNRPSDYSYPNVPTFTPAADVTYTYDANGVRVLRASTTISQDGLLATDALSPAKPVQPPCEVCPPPPPTRLTTYTVDIFPSLRLNDTTFGKQSPEDYDRSDETDQVSLVAGGSVLGRVVYAPGEPMTSSNVLLSGQHVFLEMTDHLGSTTTVIDQQTSELVERTTYSAFGRVESDYRPPRWDYFREAFKFTGKEDDVALGMTYFGARYYSPYLGTWMSADPLTIHALGADPNPYAYVRGRTTSAIDAFGLCDGSLGKEACGPTVGGGNGFEGGPEPFGGGSSGTPGGSESDDDPRLHGPQAHPPSPPPAPQTPAPMTVPLFSNRGMQEWAHSQIDTNAVAGFNQGVEKHSTVLGLIGISAGAQVAALGILIGGGPASAGYTTLDNALGTAANAVTNAIARGLGTSGRVLVAMFSALVGSNCFEAGTLVATCDGGEQPIETLREHDLVLSESDTGAVECREVIHTFERVAEDRATITIGDGVDEETLRTTRDHRFWVEGRGWVAERYLTPGDALKNPDWKTRFVRATSDEPGSARVFNIEVEANHTYFVGESRTLVHNECGPAEGEGIYEFSASSGKTYVGQSVDIASRLEQHLETGNLLEEDLATLETTEVQGGKLAREIAEQQRINQLGGVKNLQNIRNPIGPARQHLMRGNWVEVDEQ